MFVHFYKFVVKFSLLVSVRECHREAFFAEAIPDGNGIDCFVAKNAPLNDGYQMFSDKL
jgi:hypothetical protein